MINNPFLNLSDYAVCVVFAKHLIENENELRVITTANKSNDPLWDEVYQHTYLGLLTLEVFNRGITQEYFVRVVEVSQSRQFWKH